MLVAALAVLGAEPAVVTDATPLSLTRDSLVMTLSWIPEQGFIAIHGNGSVVRDFVQNGELIQDRGCCVKESDLTRLIQSFYDANFFEGPDEYPPPVVVELTPDGSKATTFLKVPATARVRIELKTAKLVRSVTYSVDSDPRFDYILIQIRNMAWETTYPHGHKVEP